MYPPPSRGWYLITAVLSFPPTIKNCSWVKRVALTVDGVRTRRQRLHHERYRLSRPSSKRCRSRDSGNHGKRMRKSGLRRTVSRHIELLRSPELRAMSQALCPMHGVWLTISQNRVERARDLDGVDPQGEERGSEKQQEHMDREGPHTTEWR